MAKNDMLSDPAVILTSKNPSLSAQPQKPLDILMEALRKGHISMASSPNTPNGQQLQPSSRRPNNNRNNNNNNNNNRRRQPQARQNQQQQQQNTPQHAQFSSGQQRRNTPRSNNNNNTNNNNNNTNNGMNNGSGAGAPNPYRNNFNLRNAQTFGSPIQNFYNTPSMYNVTNGFNGYHVSGGSGGKLGISNEHVCREIQDYYNRNRQSNDKFQSKQIIRAGLERTLQEAFPDYVMNLYLVGSSTNGIGDTPNAADICIIVRKRDAKPLSTSDTEEASPKSPASAQETSEAEPATPVDSSTSPIDKPATTPDSNEKDFIVVPESLSLNDPLVKYVASLLDSPAAALKAELEHESQTKSLVESDLKHLKVDADSAQTPVSDGKHSPSDSLDCDSESHYSEISSDITLADIERVLAGKGFALNVQLIPAKVPVLKFKDSITGLNVTLNLNQEVSIRNSQLIRDYCKMDWRFAPLAMIFKRWAAENRICNAVDQTISSYSWTLMTIHYLQTCEPPVLPCLQKLNPRRYEQHRGDIFKAIKFWRRQPARPWASQNGQNLRQLLKGLFRYYGYTYNFTQHVISVREGRLLDRSHFSRRTIVDGKAEQWIPNYWTSHLAIEEPFTKTNTASSVHDKQKFERIIDLFRLSSGSLRGVRISLFNVLADDLFFPSIAN